MVHRTVGKCPLMNLTGDNFWYSVAVEVRSDEKAYKDANNAAGMKKYGYSLKPKTAFAVAIWLTILPPSGIRYNEYFLPDQIGYLKG
eukprot:10401836-Prorocentrum_lima.AAC.1